MLARCAILLFIVCCLVSAEKPEQAFARAEAAIAKGHAEQAVPILRRWSNHVDDGVRARAGLLLGRAYVAGGKPDEALHSWDIALKDLGSSEPLLVDLQLDAGALLLKREEPAAAAERFRLALDAGHADERSYRALLAYADCCERLKRGSEAIGALLKAEALAGQVWTDPTLVNPPLSELQSRLQRLRDQQRLLERGEDRELFDRGDEHRRAGRWHQADAAFLEVLKRFPEGLWAQASAWGLGAVLSGREQTDKALVQWSSFIKARPEGTFRAAAWLGVGDALLFQRLEPDEAEKAYAAGLQVLEKLPAEPDPWWRPCARDLRLRQALLQYLHGEREKAITIAKAAVAFEPPRVLDPNAGDWLPPASGTENLLAALEGKAWGLPPDVVMRDGLTKGSLLVVFADLDLLDYRWADAAVRFEKVAHGGISARPIQRSYATFRLATCYHWLDKPEQTIACYNEILSRYPQDPWTPDVALRKGCVQYSVQKKPEDALRSLAFVMATWPDHDAARTALWYTASIYEWQERWAEAEVAYERFLRTYPKDEFRDLIERNSLPTVQGKLHGH